MDNNQMTGIKHYYFLLQQITSLLNLSLPEIRKKYVNYPYCLIDYFDKDKVEKSIEIRFDDENLTMTCLFSSEDKCQLVYLFPDKMEHINGFILFSETTLKYDYFKNRWTTSGCYIQARAITHLSSEFCLVFYN